MPIKQILNRQEVIFFLLNTELTLADHHQHHESENHSLHVFTSLYTTLCMEKSKGEKCDK